MHKKYKISHKALQETFIGIKSGDLRSHAIEPSFHWKNINSRINEAIRVDGGHIAQGNK